MNSSNTALAMEPTPPIQNIPNNGAARFENGLPGFPGEKDFFLFQDPAESPLAWLQSSKNPDLAFIVTSPFTLFPEYRPDVSEQDLEAIGSPAQNEIMVLCLLTLVSGDPAELHANLKAPLLINLRTFAGRQVVLLNESMYSEKAIYKVPV